VEMQWKKTHKSKTFFQSMNKQNQFMTNIETSMPQNLKVQHFPEKKKTEKTPPKQRVFMNFHWWTSRAVKRQGDFPHLELGGES